MSSSAERIAALVDEHGQTFAEESGLALRDTPASLFGLLVLTSLLSANLDPMLGVRAATALRKAYRTSAPLAEAEEDDVHDVLVEARYLRKHQTARQLIALAGEVEERFGGDLRRLLREAGDAASVAAVVREFTGIGPLGADIFCREVQAVWPALRPYAGERVADLAAARGLPKTASGLARAAGTDDLTVVGAALIRADRADRAAQ